MIRVGKLDRADVRTSRCFSALIEKYVEKVISDLDFAKKNKTVIKTAATQSLTQLNCNYTDGCSQYFWSSETILYFYLLRSGVWGAAEPQTFETRWDAKALISDDHPICR